MITFTELKFQNFLSFKTAELDLSNQGIVAIEGKNNSNKCFTSNGAGKSAVLEAFCWGNWGQTIRGYKADRIINRKIGKNCFVEISFYDNSNTFWTIKRYRKHSEHGNKVFLYKEGQEWSYDVDIQKKIDEILGIDFKTFLSAFIFFKNDVEAFANSTDLEQKKLLEKLYDLEKYSILALIVKQKLSALEIRYQDFVQKIDKNKLRFDMLIIDIDRLEKEATQFESDRIWKIKELEETLQKLKQQEIDEQNKFEQEKNSKLQQMSNRMIDLSAIDGVDKEIFEKDKKKMIEVLNDRLNRLFADERDVDGESKNEKKLLELNQQLKHIDVRIEVECHPPLHSDILEQTSIAVEKNLNKLRVELALREHESQELVVKKEKFEKNLGLECPTCFQIVPPEHKEKHVKELLDSISKKQIEISTLKLAEKETLAKFNDLDREWKYVQESIDQARKLERQLLNKKTDVLNAIKAAEHTLLKLEQDVDKLKNEIEKVKLETFSNPKFQREFTELEKQYNELSNSKYSNVKIAASIISTKESIEKAKVVEFPFADSIESKSKEAVETHDLNLNLKEQTKEVEKQAKHYKFFEEAFSRAGIPSYLLDNIIPTLNKYAQYYSTILTGNSIKIEFSNQTTLKSTKEIREKFEVRVVTKDGSESYEGDSSGEKRRVDLIVLFALQKTAMMRSKTRFNVLFLDEIFDTLDVAGLENVVSLLEEEVQTFPSIFVISHNDFLSSYFDSTITIEKDVEGFSSIRSS